MLLKTSSLNIGYDQKIVQQDLHLQANEGEIICMLGTNGCGKSTLLRTLSGLQPALSGDILLRNTTSNSLSNLSALSSSERASMLSLVLTERLSIDNTTVRDVVAMGRYPYTSFLGSLTEQDNLIIADALLQVGMQDYLTQFFNRLSDGEKQRVLIAKALAQQTPLILLDEPTAHLDLPNRIKTLLLLRNMAHNQHKCVIISTHELDLALQMADTIWLMIPSQGIITGTPDSLINSGAFQRAFEDQNFSFVNDGGQLRIDIKR